METVWKQPVTSVLENITKLSCHLVAVQIATNTIIISSV